jgi:hypothetical protein
MIATATTTKTVEQTTEHTWNTPAQKLFYQAMLNGLSVRLAAESSGLSYSYARKLVAKRNIKALVKREIATKTTDLRGETERFFVEAMRDTNAKLADRIKAGDNLGKLNGWQSQTIKHESDSRQALLDKTKRDELERLALLRHNMLPASSQDNIIDADVVSSRSDIEEDKVDTHTPHSLSDMVRYGKSITPIGEDESSYPSLDENFSSPDKCS